MKRTAQVAVIAVAALSAAQGGLGVFFAPVTLPALWFVARSIGGAWRLAAAVVAAAVVAEVSFLAVEVATGWPQSTELEPEWRQLWPLPIVLGLACAAGYLVASARHPATDRDEMGVPR